MPDKLRLVGHVHNVFHVTTDPIVCYNVGVDVNNFYPVTLKQIMETIRCLQTRGIRTNDEVTKLMI